MDKRQVHIRDLEGKLLFNRLYDEGSIMRFESGFGGVDHLNVQRNRWQVCDGWPEHE